MNNKLFIITGTSAVGKSTVANLLLKKLKNLKRSLTYTTRPIRAHEKKDQDYHFISLLEFKKKMKRGDFLEWANNYGNLYGTNKKEISRILNSGNNALVVVDIKGALNINKKWPEAVTIFIKPESLKQLEQRFKQRADTSAAQINQRLKIATWELARASKCDYRVINRQNQIPATVQKVKKILEKELAKWLTTLIIFAIICLSFNKFKLN